MKIQLPEHVKNIINTLNTHGFSAYAVGGCVRDTILGREPKDWDITTSAKPDQIKTLFAHTIDTGIAHGTVTVMLEHIGYEVTTYRIDGEYEDARHPKEVTFTSELAEDLRRRDLTINAMAYNEEEGLVDLFSGAEDLEEKRIRCVGDPKARFGEDALRMLRAVRFAAQLGFEVEAETAAAIRECAPTLAKISAERIQAELCKILVSPHPEKLLLAYELGLTAVFLPEFDRMMHTPQKNKHHCYNVGEHTIHVVMEVPPQKTLRIAALFHDIAKPLCLTEDEDGTGHFHGHPQVGAKLTKEILQRMKFDNDTIDRVCRLVLWHDDRPQLDAKTVRRALNRIGQEAFPEIFNLKRADVLAQSDYHREEKLEYLANYRKLYEEALAKQECFQLKDLAIDGCDLLALGLTPGKAVGTVLNELLEAVLDDPQLNEREKLLDLAHNLITPFI